MREHRPADVRGAFSSALLPPYLRKGRSPKGPIPRLYLKNVGTGDFTDALRALLGTEPWGPQQRP